MNVPILSFNDHLILFTSQMLYYLQGIVGEQETCEFCSIEEKSRYYKRDKSRDKICKVLNTKKYTTIT